MDKHQQSIKAGIQKTILFLGIILCTKSGYGQVFADFQVNGVNDSCIGCDVINPTNAVDGNAETYATLNIEVATPAAHVYQTFNFSVTGNAGDYVGLAVEDTNFLLLDADVLSGTELTTYYNNSSNNDTKSSMQFTITRINEVDFRYLIEFQTTAPFDAIELKLNAGISGASNELRVFYAYHSTEPMPIDLLAFNAVANENAVDINWTTATEINNDYFTIERSTDAKNFLPVVKIKGAGNTTLKKDYRYTDTEPPSGNSYYRLKQTDYNGKFEYFKVVQVNFKISPLHFKIYPNPASSDNAQINIQVSETALLSIIDAGGKIIFNTNIFFDEHADNRNIDLKQKLDQGIYTIMLSTDKETQVKKWVIIN